jgi:hypothetical protein
LGFSNVADRLSSDVSIRLGSRVNIANSSLVECILAQDCRRTSANVERDERDWGERSATTVEKMTDVPLAKHGADERG